MEPTDVSGVYYMRENGRLYMCTEKSIFPGSNTEFNYIERTEYHASQINASNTNSVLHPHDTLFDLCLAYLSTNVRKIDSFLGLPELIGEKIFASVRSILQTHNNRDCALILQIFQEAYASCVLEQLRVKNVVVLDRHLESFITFSHVTKVDLSACALGDDHEYLPHIGRLSL